MNKKILVVEDDPVLRATLIDKISKEEFTVFSAKNGRDGLKFALSNHPELVLLDIIMPVMDGITMLKKIRESGQWGKSVPVIMLTNVTSDTDNIINDVTVLQPSYYFVKTEMKLDELMLKIQELLNPPDKQVV